MDQSQRATPARTRVIRRESVEFMEALHRALHAPGRFAPGHAHPIVTEFLDDAAARSLTVDPVVATFSHGQVVAAAAALESPGSAALVVVPTEIEDPALVAGYGACMGELCHRQRERSVALTELLLPIGPSPWAKVAEQAGFRFLTNLVYLVRTAACGTGPHVRLDVTWTPWTPQAKALFERTLVLTYQDSADCPELCGLRPAAQVLAGHRSSGEFDPTLWSVASFDGKPVGILLLARLRRHDALELVYMGVSKDARRRGFANALLQRAVDVQRSVGANCLALAVDERNDRARRVYQRWGFCESARRSAWITTY